MQPRDLLQRARKAREHALGALVLRARIRRELLDQRLDRVELACHRGEDARGGGRDIDAAGRCQRGLAERFVRPARWIGERQPGPAHPPAPSVGAPVKRVVAHAEHRGDVMDRQIGLLVKPSRLGDADRLAATRESYATSSRLWLACGCEPDRL